MQILRQTLVTVETITVESIPLGRAVIVDFYHASLPGSELYTDILFINDGQDMRTLGLLPMLEELFASQQLRQVLCVGIHAGERMREYGTASQPDYLGRGDKAGAYTQFIQEELLPLTVKTFALPTSVRKAFAGFSLGGLSALDIVWAPGSPFTTAGVFSGSLWWRQKAIDSGYEEDADRIMHKLIREGAYKPGLRFFLEAGAHDETMDRNNNGIIDSIDDTLGLIDELEKKGYRLGEDIHYLELPDGRHDIATWSVGMRAFLPWAFAK